MALEELNEECNVTDIYQVVVLDSWLPKERLIGHCPIIKDLSHRIFDQIDKCPRSCNEVYYKFYMKKAEREVAPAPDKVELSIIYLYGPELAITIIKKTPIIEFISQIGGILGIWFGLSVFALYEHYERVLKWLRDRFISILSGTDERWAMPRPIAY